MSRIFSVLYWSFIGLSCVPMFCGALLVFLVTLPFDRNGKLLHLYTCAWAQLYFWANPLWHLKVDGRERLPWNGAAVLVANHQSLADTLVVFGLYRPFKWVSKQSVFKLPFVGWNMKLNRYVGVVRGEGGSVRRMMSACEAWLDRGVPVMLFPEGTRSPDGEVKSFKEGAFQLAVRKGVPVIPIVIIGTSHLLPKHGFVANEHARCYMKVLDPVASTPFGEDAAALSEHVRQIIIAEKRRLEEAGAPLRIAVDRLHREGR